MNNLNLAVQFFLQLAVILMFCRLVGASLPGSASRRSWRK